MSERTSQSRWRFATVRRPNLNDQIPGPDVKTRNSTSQISSPALLKSVRLVAPLDTLFRKTVFLLHMNYNSRNVMVKNWLQNQSYKTVKVLYYRNFVLLFIHTYVIIEDCVLMLAL